MLTSGRTHSSFAFAHTGSFNIGRLYSSLAAAMAVVYPRHITSLPCVAVVLGSRQAREGVCRRTHLIWHLLSSMIKSYTRLHLLPTGRHFWDHRSFSSDTYGFAMILLRAFLAGTSLHDLGLWSVVLGGGLRRATILTGFQSAL